MGYLSEIGWAGESAYGTAAATTTDAGAGGTDSFFFDSFGIVTDFNLSTVVERHTTRGIAYQVRKADPVLNERYELTISCLWQDDASRGTIYKFLETYEDNTYDSFLIRIADKPDGSTYEYIYLIGCVLQSYDIKIDVGDVVSVDLTFKCKQIDSDDWQTLVGEDYDAVLDDRTVAASLGLQADITADIEDDDTLEGSSDSASDNGAYILWIGRDTDDSTWKYEFSAVLTGINTYKAGADGTQWSGTNAANEPTYNIVGAALVTTNNIATCVPKAAVGAITVRSAGGVTTIITIAATTSSMGLYFPDVENPVNDANVGDEVLYVAGDSACVNFVCMVGTNTSDGVITEEIEMSGATPVAGVTAFRTVRIVAFGDLAAADSARIYGTVSSDPTPYYSCTVDFPAGILSIDNQLTSFSLSQNFNPVEIFNFTDSTLYNNVQGHKEVSFSANAYGDGTSMGVTDLFSKLISAAGTGDIVFKVGSNWAFTIVACSYDSITYPLKDKELTILDLEGTANSCTIDTQ